MTMQSLRPFLVFSLSLLLLLVLPHFLHARSLNSNKTVPALIVFGDSIVDPGNNNVLTTAIRCDFPPYGRDFIQHKPTGRFCNGRIPSDMIASKLGIKEILPAYFDRNLTPEDLLTGVSFASGGSGYDSLTPKIVSVFSLSDQLKFFKEYKEKLKTIAGEERAAYIVSDSIYIVIIGSDDLANTYFSTPFRRSQYDIPSYVNLLVDSASKFYQELYGLGARKIGVVGLPPIGCVPSQRTLAGGLTRECVDSYNQAAIDVNAKLSQEVQRLQAQLTGSKIIYVDIYTTLYNLIQRPSDHGFEVTTKGCCGTGTVEVTLLCNRLSPNTCQDVSKYVFWDSYHPTEKAYEVIVEDVANNYLYLLF
ncbi:GDSL esterase/lipase EXL3-like [Magnolia sinica]|uniref:GDSL esterase/lipase EXL3-like n=1 Tax=Magnolia sinica TaxID=86752 RepID=UPI002658CDDC|nr:GDSL esterase/lipase EXL3-like [Magnolia sinica]